MENFVRIGVADAAEQVWIGERALKRVIFARERFAELVETRIENFQTAGIMFPQRRFPTNQMDRCPLLGSGFGQQQRAIGKIEGRLAVFPRDLRALRFPMKPTGDHEMNDEKKLVFQIEDDALAEPPQRQNFFPSAAPMVGSKERNMNGLPMRIF